MSEQRHEEDVAATADPFADTRSLSRLRPYDVLVQAWFWPERFDRGYATLCRQFPDFHLRAETEPVWSNRWDDLIVRVPTHPQ